MAEISPKAGAQTQAESSICCWAAAGAGPAAPGCGAAAGGGARGDSTALKCLKDPSLCFEDPSGM